MSMFVSVIVPVYNKEKYIQRCIQSLLNQDYDNYEVLVINDGSTDGSEQKIRAFKDKKVMLFNKVNKGVSDSRNYGIKKSNGEFICFVDADDYVASNYISTMVKNIAQSIDYVVTSKIDVFNEKKLKSEILEYEGDLKHIPEEFYIYGFCHPVWGKLYKRKIIIENNIYFPEINISEDSFFNLNYLKKCKKIKIINQSNYYYVHYGEGNLTSLGKFEYLNVYNELYLQYKKYFQKYVSKYDCTEKILYPQYYSLIRKLVHNESFKNLKKNELLSKSMQLYIKPIFIGYNSPGFEKYIIKCICKEHWLIYKIILKLLNYKKFLKKR